MTGHVWREFFDSDAPQYMNEVFTTDSARERRRPARLDEWKIVVVMRRPPA